MCWHWLSSLAVLAALNAVSGDACAARRLGGLEFEPCTLSAAGMAQTVAAQCTTLMLPEDRAKPESRRVALAIAWVPSRAREPRPDPVLLLAGGPGQSARDSFPAVAGAFGDVLRRRNVILVDQRGTGGSSPLLCTDRKEPGAEISAEAGDPDAARKLAEDCLEHLSSDPRHFTTSDAVLDLEDVRKALGVQQLDLVGISYGTRVAQEYLRRYPQHTRAVVLDGVVPPRLALGSEDELNLNSALASQFARCESDAVCAARFPGTPATLQRLRLELAEQPQRVSFRDPLSSELREETLDAAVLGGVTRMYAYSPQLAALLPMALAELASGRSGIFMAQASMIESLVSQQITYGMQLAVLCSEDAARLKPTPGNTDSLTGNSFVDSIRSQCEVWPAGAVPANFHEPVISERPVLLLSGEFDPVTPPRYGDEVARTLPNGRHLVLPGQGHNVMTVGCVPRIMAQFLDSADSRDLDVSCLDQIIYTPPFAGPYGWEP